MKYNLLPSIKMTLILLLILAVVYPLIIAGVGRVAPGHGDGVTIRYKDRIVGYANVGQKFTGDNYFWSRPSSVDYNAAGSGGSNKGPSNADYLKQVEERIDTFMKHNPGVSRAQIPAELVTASGSGLDPDLSPAGARIQAARIARVRGMDVNEVVKLIDRQVQAPLLGLLGPAKVNVLQLNVALDEMENK